jgi:hypothetical protein
MSKFGVLSTNFIPENNSSNIAIARYVNDLPLNEEFKKEILESDFINGILPVYTKYPGLFSESFLISENIDLLNIACFLLLFRKRVTLYYA